MIKTNIKDLAKGRWAGILPALGVKKEHLTNKHGPCPLCAGKDRFRFDDKEGSGSFYCSQCGAGSGVDLVMKANGWDFKEAAREISKLVAGAPVTTVRAGRSEKAVRDEMNGIWKRSTALDGILPTRNYWLTRAGIIPDCKDLRASHILRCPGEGDHPAMVALVRGVDGSAVNLHRTYLTKDGQKANFDDPRRVMDISLPKGCAVRLSAPGDVLGIAEGLETAVCVTQLFGVPCWASLNANNLTGWTPPEGVKRVIVYGDNDLSYTGQAAAYALAKRLRVAKFEVEVSLPAQIGWDWADVFESNRDRQAGANDSAASVPSNDPMPI